MRHVTRSSHSTERLFNSSVLGLNFFFFLMPLLLFKLIFIHYIPIFKYCFLILGRYRPARHSRSRWPSGPEGKFKSFIIRTYILLLIMKIFFINLLTKLVSGIKNITLNTSPGSLWVRRNYWRSRVDWTSGIFIFVSPQRYLKVKLRCFSCFLHREYLVPVVSEEI